MNIILIINNLNHIHTQIINTDGKQRRNDLRAGKIVYEQ